MIGIGSGTGYLGVVSYIPGPVPVMGCKMGYGRYFILYGITGLCDNRYRNPATRILGHARIPYT